MIDMIMHEYIYRSIILHDLMNNMRTSNILSKKILVIDHIDELICMHACAYRSSIDVCIICMHLQLHAHVRTDELLESQ
jgi:hypothetical protein